MLHNKHEIKSVLPLLYSIAVISIKSTQRELCVQVYKDGIMAKPTGESGLSREYNSAKSVSTINLQVHTYNQVMQ